MKKKKIFFSIKSLMFRNIAYAARSKLAQVCEADEYAERYCGQDSLKDTIAHVHSDFFIRINVKKVYT